MDPEKVAYFKKLLSEWLRELLQHADETVIYIRETEYLPDLLDRASFDSERSFQLRIRDRESALIKKIKNSLQDIEDGSYGICKKSRSQID